MPGTTAAGNHTVTVETSTAATPAGTGNPTATSATYVIYAAPSVTLNPSPASGQLYGTSVTFTASASGGNPGLTYKYRFSVNASIVQDYSTTATYTTSTLPVQSNTVTVDLSTAVSPVAPEATANSTFVISGYPAATGLTVTPSAASPQLYGTAVTFTAAGQNAPALPTSAYTYRFTLDGTVVQNWSTLATWTMSATTAIGAHSLVVDVNTTATPANTPFTVTVPYTIRDWAAATGVSFTSVSPASPQVYGTADGYKAVLPPELRDRPMQDPIVIDALERWASGKAAETMVGLFLIAGIVTLVAIPPGLALESRSRMLPGGLKAERGAAAGGGGTGGPGGTGGGDDGVDGVGVEPVVL